VSRVIGLPQSAPRGARWRRLISSNRRWLGVAAIVVAALVAGRAGLNDLIESDIGRESVEQEGARAMLYSGGGVVELTCPGGLDRETGARIVCTYTDTVNEAFRAGTVLDDGSPRVGRVEVRISGWHTRGVSPGSTTEPEFAARVIQPPR
jgi:hypothetical protein